MIENNKKKSLQFLNKQNKTTFYASEKKSKIYKKTQKKIQGFSKKNKKLKPFYGSTQIKNFNLKRKIRKLKLQSSYVLNFAKKLRHEISKLEKSKSNKSQIKKLKLYSHMLKKLKFLRLYYKFRLKKFIQNKRHLTLKKVKYPNKIPKKYKPKSLKQLNNKNNRVKKYGVLKVLTIRRNILITLSDLKGNVRATITSGLLKVKGKKRQALHIVTATGQKIIKLIFKHRMLKLFMFFRGRAYRKKKNFNPCFFKG